MTTRQARGSPGRDTSGAASKRQTSRSPTRQGGDRLELQLRQALAPFLSGAALNSQAPAPVRRLVALIEAPAGSLPAEDVRKSLFALGLSAEDTAVLLDRLDMDKRDAVDAKLLAQLALPDGGGQGNQGNQGNQRALAELHRKVLEKVLVKSKTHNVKDAFRQYDAERSGHLSLPQFRTLMRDHGFIGNDTERLIKYLDAEGHQSISFHAFVGGQKLATEQKYPKTSPKKPQMAPPLLLKSEASPKTKASAAGAGMNQVAAKPTGGMAQSATAEDAMEAIRGRMRQRIMGHNKSIREVFMEFDDDGNGFLDYDEFQQFMARYHFTAEETRLVITFLDRDDSGTIDYDEFAAGLLFYRPPPVAKPMASASYALSASTGQLPKPASNKAEQSKVESGEILQRIRGKLDEIVETRREQEREVRLEFLRGAFAKCDVDGNNSLDLQEFGAFLISLGVKLRSDELATLFRALDKDNSQSIEFDEFAKACRIPLQSLSAVSPASDRGRSTSGRSSLKAVFSKYDIDGSGRLDYDEFSQLMRDHGFSDGEIVQVMKQIDQEQGGGGSRGKGASARGAIDFDAFASALKARNWDLSDRKSANDQAKSKHAAKKGPRQLPISEAAFTQWMSQVMRQNRSLEEAFRQHDSDGSGELDVDEFRRFMKHYGMKRSEDIDALVEFIDTDGSGYISLDEFLRVFGRGSVKPSLNLNKPSRQADTSAEPRVSNGQTDKVEQSRRRLEALREQELAFIRRAMRQHGSMESAFREFDRDGSNELDCDEFRDLMERYGIRDERTVSLLLKKLDVDDSGTVDLDEFLALFNPQRVAHRQGGGNSETSAGGSSGRSSGRVVNGGRQRYLAQTWRSSALASHDSVEDAFDAFSRQGNGTLSHEDFRELLTAYGVTRAEDVDALLVTLDRDGSGVIYFDEFSSVFGDPPRTDARNEPKPATRHGGAGAKTRSASDGAVEPGGGRRTARLRDLEVKWIQRALACHPSLEDAFCQYDEDGNGELDHDEFQCVMKRYGIASERDIDTLIDALDADDSGTINLAEFSSIFHLGRLPQTRGQGGKLEEEDELFNEDELQAVLEIERDLAKRIAQQSRDLRLAFRKFDQNGNGQLEYKEFRAVLKSFRLPEMEIRKVIRHLDRDVSGFIDYKEFISGFSLSTDSSPTAGAGGRRKSGNTITRNAQGKAGSPTRKGDRSSSPTSVRQRKSSSTSSGSDENGGSDQQGESADGPSGDALKKKLLARILSTHGTVQSVFRQYDVDRVGYLTSAQFVALATDFKLTRQQALQLQDALDRDGSGAIEYEEFLAQLVIRDPQ